ncbi:MAG: sugar ABC transporter permease [Actinobacteria bacterium]|nr:sugar ABC transporter permease [Actinomycetota bacterium]
MSIREATTPRVDSRLRTALRGQGAGGMFLAPYAIGVVLLIAVPAVMNIGYALTDYSGLTPTARFTGLANVRRMLADPLFYASIRASLAHTVIVVPLRLLVALGLGLLLAAPRRGGRLYRAAAYLPTVVPDVALALLFLWILNPLYGPLNAMLGMVGLPQPAWLTTPWTARLGVILMLLFPIGEAFLVVLAARRTIAPDLYDASAVDGAGPWQQFRHVTFPLIAPILVLLAIRDTILMLQVSFVPAYIMTDGRPAHATLYLPLYIYDQAFEFGGFGYAALLSVVLLLITLVLVAAQGLLAKRWRLLP